MRRLLLTALAVSAVAGPALAELPPHVYARARAEATSVVVVRVTSVSPIPDGADRGPCAFEGVVTGVERGDAHAVGDTLRIDVPCVGPRWTHRPGPFPGYDEVALPYVHEARLWLNGDRLVLRGLEEVAPRPRLITP
jgi:hypothetical protein